MRTHVMLDARESAGKTLAMVAYVLYALGAFTMLPAIVAFIMNLIKRDDVRGTFVDSHFGWQIRTAVWGFVFIVLGWLLSFVIIGIPILFATYIWIVYRLVKGFLKLNDHQPVA